MKESRKDRVARKVAELRGRLILRSRTSENILCRNLGLLCKVRVATSRLHRREKPDDDAVTNQLPGGWRVVDTPGLERNDLPELARINSWWA